MLFNFTILNFQSKQTLFLRADFYRYNRMIPLRYVQVSPLPTVPRMVRTMYYKDRLKSGALSSTILTSFLSNSDPVL